MQTVRKYFISLYFNVSIGGETWWVGERRTDLRGPRITLEIGKHDKLIFSVML